MKMAFFVGIFIAAPYILYQVWAFVAPGLYPHARRYALPFIFFGTLFFVGGGIGAASASLAWSWGGWTAVCVVAASFGITYNTACWHVQSKRHNSINLFWLPSREKNMVHQLRYDQG